MLASIPYFHLPHHSIYPNLHPPSHLPNPTSPLLSPPTTSSLPPSHPPLPQPSPSTSILYTPVGRPFQLYFILGMLTLNFSSNTCFLILNISFMCVKILIEAQLLNTKWLKVIFSYVGTAYTLEVGVNLGMRDGLTWNWLLRMLKCYLCQLTIKA